MYITKTLLYKDKNVDKRINKPISLYKPDIFMKNT